jgi:Fe-S cluster biogenesis protein NfuA
MHDKTDKIIQLLSELRPSILSDGGDISFVKLEDNILYIKLHGACVTCPISSYHLKEGIEVVIKQHLPEITSVIAVF